MVNLVLGGVGRPGLEPGTNALKGRRRYKICHRSRYAAVVLAQILAQSGYPAGSLEEKSRSRSRLTLAVLSARKYDGLTRMVKVTRMAN
jgi:hypothetical protein